MALTAAILGAGALGALGAAKASQTQAKAAKQGLDAQERMFQEQKALQEPFRQAGLASQNQLLTLLGLQGGDAASAEYGSLTKPFGMTQFEADPGYAFRFNEGQRALERSAAARGGLLSGGTGKALARYGQEAGSQEYMNAFNRYQTERAARLNPLQSMMGAGQSSANVLTQAAGQTGQNLMQGYGNLGQARASGYVGTTNALTGALSQGMNLYAQMPLLNAQAANMAAQTNYYNTMAMRNAPQLGGLY